MSSLLRVVLHPRFNALQMFGFSWTWWCPVIAWYVTDFPVSVFDSLKMERFDLKHLGSHWLCFLDNKEPDKTIFFSYSFCSLATLNILAKRPLTYEPWHPQTAPGLRWHWPHCSCPAPPAGFCWGCSRTLQLCTWASPAHWQSGSTGSSPWPPPESRPCPEGGIHTQAHATLVSITVVLSLNSLDRDTAEYHSCAQGDLVHFHPSNYWATNYFTGEILCVPKGCLLPL